jgi:hypothetical protein
MTGQTVLDLLRNYFESLDHGSDPIEALHGHQCGPTCWHWEAVPEDQKEKLLRAPWNQKP